LILSEAAAHGWRAFLPVTSSTGHATAVRFDPRRTRLPAITPNQLVFAVIRGMKAINFNHAICLLPHWELIGKVGF